MNNPTKTANIKPKKKKYFDDVDQEAQEKNVKPKKKKIKKVVEEEIKLSEDEEVNNEEFIIDKQQDQNEPKEEMENNSDWSKEDILELIRRMEVQLPKNDTVSFTNRVEKLDWNEIQFGTHSVDECYEKWRLIRSKVRHFRLLGEILEDAKAWAEKPWSAPHSKRKTRHPEQPPRPLSSFMLFYMDKKNKMVKRHPDLKLTEISRLIGDKYKALSEEKKAYYLEKAKIMQQDYKQNLSKFYEKYPELMRVTKKGTNESKKPLPPIKLYLQDKLLKHENDPDYNKAEFTEKYKETWKNLSTKKKAYWIRLAKEEEEKYLDNLPEDEEKPRTSYKSVISKEENGILDRLAGKPEKPPNSAYSLFSRLMLQDKDQNYVDGEPKNRMREVALKWKDLPEQKKKEYAERVQHMHEAYKLDFANYLETLPEDKKAEELAKLQPKKKPGRIKQKSKQKSTASRGPKKELFKHEPEKPPVTAWDLFKYEYVNKNSHLPSKIAYNQAAAAWKILSKKDIEKYKKKHEQMKLKYIADYEAFLKSLSEEELKEYSSMKNAVSDEDGLNEDSGEEDTSEIEEEENCSTSASNSAEDSDSGVSEDEC